MKSILWERHCEMTLAVSSHGVQCPCVPVVEHFAASSCVSLTKVTLKALSSFLMVFRKPTKETVYGLLMGVHKKKCLETNISRMEN